MGLAGSLRAPVPSPRSRRGATGTGDRNRQDRGCEVYSTREATRLGAQFKLVLEVLEHFDGADGHVCGTVGIHCVTGKYGDWTAAGLLPSLVGVLEIRANAEGNYLSQASSASLTAPGSVPRLSTAGVLGTEDCSRM